MSVEQWKNKGNAEFSKKNYSEAIKCYTKAIELDNKNPALFTNRSAAYAGLHEWQKSLSDAEKSISINPDWIKVLIYIIKKS